MGTGRQYDEEFKKQAIRLAKEIGVSAGASELGIPKGTLGTWVRRSRDGEIDTGEGTRSPEESLSIVQQLQEARKRIKELEKRTVSSKSSTNFSRRPQLFSPPAVGSREGRTTKVHRYEDR